MRTHKFETGDLLKVVGRLGQPPLLPEVVRQVTETRDGVIFVTRPPECIVRTGNPEAYRHLTPEEEAAWRLTGTL